MPKLFSSLCYLKNRQSCLPVILPLLFSVQTKGPHILLFRFISRECWEWSDLKFRLLCKVKIHVSRIAVREETDGDPQGTLPGLGPPAWGHGNGQLCVMARVPGIA